VVNVLVVTAHPDDEVLGMGGTLALHARRGDDVRVVCLTDGSSAQYPNMPERWTQKHDDARRALATIGVGAPFVHDFPDMRLDTVPHVEVNRVIERHVAEHRPEVVYSVHPDVNLDHAAVFRSVSVATRPLPSQSVRRVLTYAPLSSIEWTPPALNSFVPTWFVDISSVIDVKLAAFACYTTEQREYPHPRSARAIEAHAAAVGSSIGCAYGEALMLVRSVEQLTSPPPA
jgi:LmbE family N-acetylglucosaminyl deacetylase